MSTSPGTLPPTPPSFEKRLPLALALMMLVLLASQYIFKPAPGPKPVVTPRSDKAAAAAVVQSPVTKQAAANIAEAPIGTIGGSAVTETNVDTVIYTALCSPTKAGW